VSAPPAEALRLAAYGSLRSSLATLRELGVADRVTRLGACTLRGDLFDLGDFPGVIPGDGLVHGELLQLHDAAVLTALDAYEDCSPDIPWRGLYRREWTPLDTPDLAAWVYWYNGPVTPTRRIAHGDWLRHLAERPPG
jgi:gamma-glutamylcyclotransferase (GGCT)/AIG2-like uncharacterized protein YtfP